MRLFIAITLPQNTITHLNKIANQLKHHLISGNIIEPRNYHLTLSFLDEVSESFAPYIYSAMDSLQEAKKFTLSLSEINIFEKTNIVYVKYKSNKQLIAIHKNLTEKLQQSGLHVDGNKYHPHTTLIRKAQFDMPFTEVAKLVDIYNVPFDVTSIDLYQSVINKNGANYKKIYSVDLK